MRKRLYILRHAKSDWSASLPDKQRPLNKRGTRAVKTMGAWMRDNRVRPAAIDSSPARRAEQTVLGIVDYLDYPSTAIHWEERLYLASLDTLLDLLEQRLPGADSLMMVGHNPGLEELVCYLVPARHRDGHGKLFPTAALAVLDVPARVSAGCADLIALHRPRDLSG